MVAFFVCFGMCELLNVDISLRPSKILMSVSMLNC